jgi:UDP-2,3-diacylglucosamine pyrophosphatase LpxH
MQTFKKRIKYSIGNSIKIKPIFDVHFGSTNCDIAKFKKYLSNSDSDTYFIGGGDLLDSICVTDPRYRKSNDDTFDDDVIDEQINQMVQILKPYQNKIIGLSSGNHEDVIVKKCGTNPIKRICKELNIEFLGYSSMGK